MVLFIPFAIVRLFELITLIPTLGMLAYFVHGFVSANQLTPEYILLLFITSVLAAAWALATVLRRRSTRESAIFVALVDLAFVGTFIAAVYELRGIASANCSNFTAGSFYLSLGPFGYIGRSSNSPLALNVNKTCAMLKASFAFGIINIILFFTTFMLALFMHRRERDVVVKETVVRRRSHDSRRGHSRSGGHRRSSRDSRRQYYV
ncbi:MAG: hypothetical protein FRX48_08717 [Lasallia pustulata]|uniref:MARVEL domain-containing protein n=1 Tax=Lasallia pustulata TaxID=136370 RepID=A0A5M8PEY1_9LECA|nr:MAG: hypothetical protein FRX48_08717 [Lasallia pustulata]